MKVSDGTIGVHVDKSVQKPREDLLSITCEATVKANPLSEKNVKTGCGKKQ